MSAVVSDWWCFRAGAVESSSAVVAGEVVPNRQGTHRWLYATLRYRGGYSTHHGTCAGIPRGGTPSANWNCLPFGLYTILSLTILYGIYCNTGGGEGGKYIAQSCDEGGKWGAQTKLVFAKNITDSCTYAST